MREKELSLNQEAIQEAPFTKRDIMKMFSISLSKVNRDLSNNTLNCIKLGSSVRFSRDNITDYATAQHIKL